MPSPAEPEIAVRRGPIHVAAPRRPRRYGLWNGIPADIRRLWTCVVATICGLAFAGTAVVSAAHLRMDAVDGIARETAPLLGSAWDIDASLSAADAVAASAFLSGSETPAQRAGFDADIRRAQSGTITAARATGSGAVSPECAQWRADSAAAAGPSTDGPPADAPSTDAPPADAGAALTTLSCQIPVYVGLIDEARANNRQRFPVGAAYLRRASSLMQSAILPAATTLTRTAELRQDTAYRRATRGGEIVLIAVGGAGAIVILLVVQLALARWTRRRLNPFLLAGTLLTAAALAWTLTAFAGERASLVRTGGYGPAAQLDLLRVRAFRAESDALHWRIAQGGTVSYDRDFLARRDEIEAQAVAEFSIPSSGEPSAGEPSSGEPSAGEPSAGEPSAGAPTAGNPSSIAALARDALSAGTTAIDPRSPAGADTARNAARVEASFAALDTAVLDARARALTTFQATVTDARRRLAGLPVGSAVLFALAIASCGEGLRRRLVDYR